MEASEYNPAPCTPIKRWPWWLHWLEPHHAEDRKRFLVRCQCGRVMWINAPQRIKKLHAGHLCRPCLESSLWNFVKMKLWLLDRLTWRERMVLWSQKGRE